MSLRVLGSVALWLVDVSAVDIPSVKLNNGVEMPMLMFGSAGFPSLKDGAEEQTLRALRVGFPGVDTANNYLNQRGVGRAVAEFNRSDVFITSKVAGLDELAIPFKEYRGTLSAANGDLKKLSVDYVDLMLLHNPPKRVLGDGCKVLQEQWRALEDFMKVGKARAIGVSNYCQADLECILQTATVMPAVNQVLIHVGMGPDPRSLKSYCDAKGITVQAYSPLGAYNFSTFPPTKDHSLITSNFTNGIGQKYNKTGAQMALKWVSQHGIPLNTASSSEKHLLQDLEIFEFNISDADMKLLDEATTPAGEPDSAYAGEPICGPVENAMMV